MRNFKLILIVSCMTLCSGCGKKAYYLPTGQVSIAEEPFTVKSTVSNKDGTLTPGVITTYGAGSEIKGK